jgi:DNA-directed RNA polymerase subunit N (RpoN/RPB10)
MKYRYQVAAGAIDTKGRYTKRPIVEVGLSRGGLQRKFLALIDSGADQITMPAAIADALGIDRGTCRRRSLMGVTMERIEGFVADIDIRVDNQAEAISAPVVFIDTEVPVLLGQEAFFDRYRIKFEKDHGTFEITPAPSR